VGPSIRGKGIEAVTLRKHTLAVGYYSDVGPLICRREICSDLEETHDTLYVPVTER
jgi:hypothetical protein